MKFLMLNRKFLPLLLLVVILIAIYVALQSPSNFPIKTVKVNGDFSHIGQDSIVNTVQPFAKSGFFAVDISGVQESLKKLPWVGRVTVTRVWPGELRVNIQEKKPIATWNQAGLMVADGSVFYPDASSVPNNLPGFSGHEGDQGKILNNFKKMNDILNPIGLNITHVNLSSDASWQITLSNGTEVMLGSENILKHLQRYVEVFPKVFAKRRQAPVLVDMRYSHGMAVKWDNGDRVNYAGQKEAK